MTDSIEITSETATNFGIRLKRVFACEKKSYGCAVSNAHLCPLYLCMFLKMLFKWQNYYELKVNVCQNSIFTKD
jgi:hypothetical protein